VSSFDFFNTFKNKKIAFCGVGATNFPLVDFFSEFADKIIVCDRKERTEFSTSFVEKLKKKKVGFFFGKNYLKNLEGADVVFRTPGVPFFSSELILLRRKGVVITSEVEVFFEVCPCKIIGITGSDGKTTTATLITKMLEADGKTVHLGGNIGTPLLPKIKNIKKSDIVVVELSSFQLISMSKSPDIAVVTNIEPNHLDVHKNMSEYIKAKENILLHQNAFSIAVLNFDNKLSKNFSNLVRGKRIFFSRIEKDTDLHVRQNKIFIGEKQLLNIKKIQLQGKHNLENFLAAAAVVHSLDCSVSCLEKVAKEFTGIEHRTEFVGEVSGVRYYNDSIATSPTRTIKGMLSLFDNKIILITGGYDKKISYNKLGEVINSKVKVLILMGQTAKKIESSVKKAKNFDKKIKIIHAKSMTEAVSAAKSFSKKGDIVALSPASASFDSYKNFEARGKDFKKEIILKEGREKVCKI
jgi:UDP-N-acetylmuramoylalanine--D-glutamate ligase